MVSTKKFSEFSASGTLIEGETIVGLDSGVNAKFTAPPQFVEPFTTATRPATPANGMIGYNTTINNFEYYNGTSWFALDRTADLLAFEALLAAYTHGAGASLVGLQNQTGVNTKTVQDLANAKFIVQQNNGSMVNAQALGSLTTGILKSTTSSGILSISLPLTSIDGLSTSADQMLYTTGANVYATTSLTALARSLIADTTTTAMQSTLGLGSAATHNTNFFLQVANSLSDVASVSSARNNLGLGTSAVKTATDNSQSYVSSAKGSFTIGHVLLAADVLGTVKDGGSPAGMGTVLQVDTGAGLTGGPITSTGTIVFANIADGEILANISGSSLYPSGQTVTALMDYSLGSTQGDILYRNGTIWTVLTPGTNGQFLTTGGPAANVSWTSEVHSGSVTSVATNNGITGGTITTTGTLGLDAISNNTVLANISGGSLFPSSTSLTALIDSAIGNTQGDILYRNATVWTVLAPGASGDFLKTQGAAANPIWDSVPSPTPTAPAGTTNDVQFNTSGAFAADTGNFGFDPTKHSFWAGQGCSAAGTASIALGRYTNANGNYSIAIGAGGNASAANTFAFGPSTALYSGSVVWTDQGGTNNNDTAANQWSATFAGGFYFYEGATNVLSINTSGNTVGNNLIQGYATTVTAAATTTLVVGSKQQQFFTGSTTQIVVLPVTSTLILGQSYYIVNNSSGAVTVNSSGGNVIQIMGASTTLLVTCISLSGTTAASWSVEYVGAVSGGTVNSGLINQLGYYAAAGTAISGLAIVNSAGLLTSSGGVPGWVAYTGTGAPVLANTPTLITPILGVASATSVAFASSNGVLDANNLPMLFFVPTATAVNHFSITNAASGSGPSLAANGTDTNIIAIVKGQGTGGVSIKGTGTNDNATAGYVGEYVTSNVPVGSSVSLTNSTPANVTSISLTAGDWDVVGNLFFTIGGTCTTIDGQINTTSATFGDASVLLNVSKNTSGVSLTNSGYTVPYVRVLVNTTTTVYLVGQATFSTSTVTACGTISARRVR